jgi:WD40 repeat protein
MRLEGFGKSALCLAEDIRLKTRTVFIFLLIFLSACTSATPIKTPQTAPISEQATDVFTTPSPQPVPSSTPTQVLVNAPLMADLQVLKAENVKNLAQVAALWPANLTVSGMAFYPGKDRLLLGIGKAGPHAPNEEFSSLKMSAGTQAVFWDLHANSQQAVLEPETVFDPDDVNLFKSYKSVAVSPDGQHVVLAGNDRLLFGSLTSPASDKPQFTRQEILYEDFQNPNVDRGAAFSPDGRLLAIANGYGDIRVWDVQTRQKMATFLNGDPNGKPEDFMVCFGEKNAGITFTPDGSTLLEMCAFKIVSWDLRSGKRSEVSGLERNVFVFAMNPAGNMVVTGDGGGSLSVWKYPSWEAGQPLNSFHNKITNLVFSVDGSLLASGSQDGQVDVWDTSTWKHLTTVEAVADFMAFSPDGRYLVLGTHFDGGTLWGVSGQSAVAKPVVQPTPLSLPVQTNMRGDFERLNAENGSWLEPLVELWPGSLEVSHFTIVENPAASSASLNPFFLIYSGTAGKKLVLWDPQNNRGSELFSLDDSAMIIDRLAASPDGKWVVLAARNLLMLGGISSDEQGTPSVNFQEIPTGDLLEKTPLLTNLWPAFSHNNRILAVENGLGDILLWDLIANQKLEIIHREIQNGISVCSHHSAGLYFTLDDKALISACKADILSLDLTTYKNATLLKTQGDGGVFTLSPDGSYLAQAAFGEANITVRKFPSGGQTARLAGHDLPIINLAFSPDGNLLASSSQDGTFVVWDTHTWKRLTSLPVRTFPFVFTPDNKFVITGAALDKSVWLWGVKNGSSAAARSGVRLILVENKLDLHAWKSALPDTWLVKEGAFPRYELRLVPTWKVIQDCPYGRTNHLIRRQTGLTGKITDLQTGSVIATNTFWGASPDSCPLMYSFSITSTKAYLDGPQPELNPFTTWVKGALGPLGFQ